jgi:hypothetical protein
VTKFLSGDGQEGGILVSKEWNLSILLEVELKSCD